MGKKAYKSGEINRKGIRIPNDFKHEYVYCLPKPLEQTIMENIEEKIHTLLLSEEEKRQALEDANCSKVCDLTETVEITFCL